MIVSFHGLLLMIYLRYAPCKCRAAEGEIDSVPGKEEDALHRGVSSVPSAPDWKGIDNLVSIYIY